LIAEDAGLQVPARDVQDFAALLRRAPGLPGLSVIATSPLGRDMLGPDREICLEEGAVVADSHPISLEGGARA